MYSRIKRFLAWGSIGLILGCILICWMGFGQRPPNVILITVDALRADHLSCYGYPRNTSPCIDSLTHQGIVFTQALSASSHTPPSIGSIATGLPPYEHLMLKWGDQLNAPVTLAEFFAARHYRTIFLGGNGAFHTGLPGFARGFQKFDEQIDSHVVTDAAIDFIGKEPHRPFFMWIHYMNTHTSYNADPAYIALFTKDQFGDPHRSLPIVDPFPEGYGLGGIPKPLAQDNRLNSNPDYYIALYDAAIRTVDDEIERIVLVLRKLQLSRKTIVIITADHGEMLGEHNYYFHHGRFLCDKLVLVPFIIHAENLIAKEYKITGQVCAHVQLFPILRELLAYRPCFLRKFPIRADFLSAPEYFYSDDSVIQKCVRTSQWKLLLNFRTSVYDQYGQNDYELYDIKNDPQELKNMVSAEPEVFQKLRLRLQKAIIRAAQKYNHNRHILDERTRGRLRSLGYVQ